MNADPVTFNPTGQYQQEILQGDAINIIYNLVLAIVSRSYLLPVVCQNIGSTIIYWAISVQTQLTTMESTYKFQPRYLANR